MSDVELLIKPNRYSTDYHPAWLNWVKAHSSLFNLSIDIQASDIVMKKQGFRITVSTLIFDSKEQLTYFLLKWG